MDYRTLKYVPLATAATTILPLVARAQVVAPPPVAGNTALRPVESDGSSTLATLVGTVITIILWVATVAAIIYLLLSGFNYITAGGDQEKADTARKGIINAVIGIVVIMAAFFIFNAASTLGTGIGGGSADIGIGSI
ncbi:MAG: pilin [bacterium]|nr:pilin [bacterium]